MVEWHGMCVCKARERLGSTAPTLQDSCLSSRIPSPPIHLPYLFCNDPTTSHHATLHHPSLRAQSAFCTCLARTCCQPSSCNPPPPFTVPTCKMTPLLISPSSHHPSARNICLARSPASRLQFSNSLRFMPNLFTAPLIQP